MGKLHLRRGLSFSCFFFGEKNHLIILFFYKVEIHVNDEKVPYLMKVGEAGEAFFVFETDHQVPEEFQTSPLLQASADNRSDIEVGFFILKINHFRLTLFLSQGTSIS